MQMEQEQVYGFRMIHMNEMTKLLQKERAMLVDLRDADSYREGHIKNAKNLPYDRIAQWERELPERDRKSVV